MIFEALPGVETGNGWAIARGDVLAVLPQLDDESVDGVITDPPYSSGGQFRGDRAQKTAIKYQSNDAIKTYPDFDGDGRDARGFVAWAALWLAECWRITRRGGIVACSIDWRMLPSMTDALQAGGWIWRGVGVWRKTIARPQLGRFTQEAEFLVWGSKGELPMERDVGALRGAWAPDDVPPGPLDFDSDDFGGGWWNVPPVPGDGREHLTEKPVALVRRWVQVIKPGGIVLDPFLGSGTAVVASRLEGRRCYGLELAQDYKRIAVRRSREFDAQAERGSFDGGQLALLGPSA